LAPGGGWAAAAAAAAAAPLSSWSMASGWSSSNLRLRLLFIGLTL
jgi:hypothetical protein